MKRLFIGGILVGAMLILAVPAALVALGVVSMGASSGPGALETAVAGWAMEQSVEVQANAADNPYANDARAIETGLMEFREMCVQCHGGPRGVERGAFAKGLTPPPPHLADVLDEWSDAEIFWIVKHGIRMTGMPAFGSTHSDDEIWKIVAFVRQLRSLSEDQMAMLTHADGAGHEHGRVAPASGRDHLRATDGGDRYENERDGRSGDGGR